jgi:hypothetical protein
MATRNETESPFLSEGEKLLDKTIELYKRYTKPSQAVEFDKLPSAQQNAVKYLYRQTAKQVQYMKMPSKLGKAKWKFPISFTKFLTRQIKAYGLHIIQDNNHIYYSNFIPIDKQRYLSSYAYQNAVESVIGKKFLYEYSLHDMNFSSELSLADYFEEAWSCKGDIYKLGTSASYHLRMLATAGKYDWHVYPDKLVEEGYKYESPGIILKLHSLQMSPFGIKYTVEDLNLLNYVIDININILHRHLIELFEKPTVTVKAVTKKLLL